MRPQVLGKILKKSRLALRGTPDQKVHVLKQLLNETVGEEVAESPNSLSKQLPESTVTSVKDFFLKDDISRPSPNLNDVITVFEGNQKKKVSVKHLMYSVKETYAMFMKEHPEVKVGLSKFFDLKPENIRSFTKMPHNVCVCQIHENLRCALKTLRKSNEFFSNIKTDNEMHLNFTCQDPKEECFFNECEFCFDSWNFRFFESEIEDLFQSVSWSKWVKTDQARKNDTSNHLYCNIEKVKKTGTIQELLNEICDQAPSYLDHEYIKIEQSCSSRQMIEKALKKDSDSAVIIVDFAEKFKCIQQNATQSAHYGQTPISIFTVAIYHQKFYPKAIVSDVEKHSKEVVLAYMDVIFETLPATAKRVDVWSDNATSQFKNQYVINSIDTFQERFKIKLVWNFFAPMHGKSVVDGIGGTLKRYVRDRIVAQDLQVKSAEDFVSVAENHSTGVILMSPEDIEDRNSAIKLSTIIKKSKQIADVKKNHCFEFIVENGKKVVKKVVSHKVSP